MFRPLEMMWVDLLVDRGSVNQCLEQLGRLRIIELQRYDRSKAPFEVVADRDSLRRLLALQQELERAADYLPAEDAGGLEDSCWGLPTESVLPGLEQRCRDWLTRALPLGRRLREARTRIEQLELLSLALEALPSGDIAVDLLRARNGQSYPPFVALGTAADLDSLDVPAGESIVRSYPLADDEQGPDGRRMLVVGVTGAAAVKELEQGFHSRGLRFVQVPAGLSDDSVVALRQVRRLQAEQARERDQTQTELAELNDRTGIASDLWLLRRHRWANEKLMNSLTGQHFVWLGGWVPVRRYDELVATLRESGIPFLVSRDAVGGHGPAPVQLDNPAWIRRFETFVKGFGIPGADDVDPSPLLAIITPIMFGYMFGDVGHGAVLMLVGWLARRRMPVLELLIPAGLLSVVFGFLYGSLFCDEHLLPALWLRPMEEPLLLLTVPIVFGWLAIFASMVLSAVQAHWHGSAVHWWYTEAPAVLLYVALAMVVFNPRAGSIIALAAVAWFFVGTALAVQREKGGPGILKALLTRLAELLEAGFQLVINTISFARLGAFALAHAGLSAAVITMAMMPESILVRVIILIAGNVIVIALEGLVVSIQTTRLVMFEFFRRFMVGAGRPFNPLSLPNHTRMVS
jgi:V/A-type H+-transporting ATPase subunit I